MSGEPWAKFFWKDWESDPALKLCSLAAQGLWLRLLCIAAASTIKGEVRIGRRPCTVDDVARLVGIKTKEAEKLIGELEQNGVFDRAHDGAIVSRRMVRDAQNHDEARRFGKRGGRPKSRDHNENSDNPPLLEKETPRARARAASASASESPEVEGEGKGVQGEGSGGRGGPAECWTEWWREYPHKVGKREAERAYRSALQRAGPEELFACMRRYAATKPRDRPWCNPATWLNQDRWHDEPAVDEPTQRVNGHAASGRVAPVESLYLGAIRAVEKREQEEQFARDSGARDEAPCPLLDRRRTGGG